MHCACCVSLRVPTSWVQYVWLCPKDKYISQIKHNTEATYFNPLNAMIVDWVNSFPWRTNESCWPWPFFLWRTTHFRLGILVHWYMYLNESSHHGEYDYAIFTLIQKSTEISDLALGGLMKYYIHYRVHKYTITKQMILPCTCDWSGEYSLISPSTFSIHDL